MRIIPLGGFDPRTLMAQKVVVHGKKELNGVFGSKPVHMLSEEEKKKPLKVTDYYVDLGLPADDVKKLVDVGDSVTWQRDFAEMGNCLTSKAFDDRVGVYVMLEALKKVKNKPLQAELYAVATVQEEVGVRGATTSAIGLDPDIGIAVDMIEFAPKLDAVILVSGDGDFVPLVEHLKHAVGCFVEVMAFQKSCAQKLIDSADNFIDMDVNPKKFLIPGESSQKGRKQK